MRFLRAANARPLTPLRPHLSVISGVCAAFRSHTCPPPPQSHLWPSHGSPQAWLTAIRRAVFRRERVCERRMTPAAHGCAVGLVGVCACVGWVGMRCGTLMVQSSEAVTARRPSAVNSAAVTVFECPCTPATLHPQPACARAGLSSGRVD
eukprot:615117-Rhodomonas_salina.1